MLKIIKKRTPEVIKDYYIEFLYKDDPEAGFMFPATSTGDPDFDKMPPAAKANYERCLTDPALKEPEFVEDERTYMNPAVGLCSCGQEIILDADYQGAVRCDCGKWYNIFGQELKDPEYWERDDDDYCFMACTEDL
jgi:hypothetical protein